jgi:TPR repeat protein
LAAEPARGLAYLRSAAEQTLYPPVAAQAAVTLGQIYERGLGLVVTPNRAEAVKFYRLALQRGGANPQLQNHVSQLERQLSIDLKMGKK